MYRSSNQLSWDSSISRLVKETFARGRKCSNSNNNYHWNSHQAIALCFMSGNFSHLDILFLWKALPNIQLKVLTSIVRNAFVIKPIESFVMEHCTNLGLLHHQLLKRSMHCGRLLVAKVTCDKRFCISFLSKASNF